MYERLKIRCKRTHLLSWVFTTMVFVVNLSYAQQEPHFTQYMFNRLSYNPAYAGSNGAICLTGFYRNQWMGMKIYDSRNGTTSSSALQTTNITFDMPVKFLHGGIGATLMTDQIATHNNVHIKLDYAYRFQLPKGNLAFGLELQVVQATFDMTNLFGINDINEYDQIGSTQDDVLLSANGEGDLLFDLGFGAYYLIPGKFYAGFSASKLLESASTKLAWQDRRFYYFMAGYEWILPSYPSLKVLPSAQFKHDFSSAVSWQLYGSVLIEYENKIWGGVGTRIHDAISILGGFTWNNFKLGVAYDIPTSRLSTVSFGSLELMLRYCFKIENPPKPNTIYGNTRY